MDNILEIIVEADKVKAEELNISLECLLMYRLLDRLDNLTVTTVEP